jgi:hypothetical protein
MKKYIVVSLLAATLALSVTVRAQEGDTAAVFSQLADALNGGDVDAAMELVADDAVLTFVPDVMGTGPITGRDRIRAWYEGLVAQHIRAEPGNLQVDGNRVTWTNKVWLDDFEALGITPVEYTGEGVVEEGKIKSYTETMTDVSLAEFQAAMSALPATGGTAPTAVLLPWLSIVALLLLVTGLRWAFDPTR